MQARKLAHYEELIGVFIRRNRSKTEKEKKHRKQPRGKNRETSKDTRERITPTTCNERTALLSNGRVGPFHDSTVL